MTDTHTHLYMDSFAGDEQGAVTRAFDAGVNRLVFPNVDMSSVEPMMALHRQFPENTVIAIGLHPTELGQGWKDDLKRMKEMLDRNPEMFAAIGETGIDLYWTQDNIAIQREAFSEQYDWAAEYDKPLIIHCREGFDDTLDIISGKSGKQPAMVFHSFTAGLDEVKKIRSVCDPYFGINGIVTFKNAKSLREALPEIRLEKIVLETDSPYLSPVPHRGKRNESSYIPYIRDCVANCLGIDKEEVERTTDHNADIFFK